MIERIDSIALYVNDQEKAKRFWVEKLGFKVKADEELGPNDRYVEVAPWGDDKTSFVLYNKKNVSKKNPTINSGHPTLLFRTDNVDKMYIQLREHDVRVGELMDLPYGRMFSFKDQDGNSYIVRKDKELFEN